MTGEDIRTPRWFIATITAAVTLMAIGWAAAEMRRGDFDSIQQSINLYRAEMAVTHQRMWDSLNALAQRVRADTYRLCLLERKGGTTMSQACAEMFGGVR